ncbi:MAG TPA: hypothetical protein VJ440_06745 [Candidatus Brocadiaceae bacterium]|nr:hypothetical protein [Candidatus Brocadiaceae bacterium]
MSYRVYRVYKKPGMPPAKGGARNKSRRDGMIIEKTTSTLPNPERVKYNVNNENRLRKSYEGALSNGL